MGNMVLIAVLVLAYLFVVGACLAAFLRKEEELEHLYDAGSEAGDGRRHREPPLADAAPEKLSPPLRGALDRRPGVRERDPGRPRRVYEGGARQPDGPGARAATQWPTARRAAVG